MDDKDLKALKSIEVPPPSDEARSAALQMAAAAFDEAAENFSSQSQGSRAEARPRSTFTISLWEWIMDKRMLMGTVAASLLVVPIAAHMILNSDQAKLVELTQLTSNDEVKKEPARADEKVQPGRRDEVDTTTETRETTGVDQNAETLEDAAGNEQFEVAVNEQPAAMPDAAAPNPEPAPKPQAEAEDLVGPVGNGRQRLAPPPSETQPDFMAKLKREAPGGSKFQSSGVIRDLRVDGDGESQFAYDQTSPQRNIVVTPPQEENRDKFEKTSDNPVKRVEQEPVSTFSIDVDTASYAFVRRNLENGALPDRNSVRVEEMINYFSYDYPAAETAEEPFKPSVALYPSPWNENTMLLHIGIKGHEVVPDEKPRSNLVFLIDVSGSMQSRDKLPLLKSAFRLLVDTLEGGDTVSIVTYAGNAGTVLEPTRVSDKAKILAALEKLQSGGSTAGHQGIRQAYALAEQEFDKEGINRVILATDGDFNVGISDVDQLKSYIETKRKSGVFLSVLGFGQGNYNDHLMQVLAQNGNGNAAYIDSLREAQKVLVEEAGSTLFPIATDVKIQVEFNPAQIAEYRLIGYETRALRREDFNNDKIDAGDIGSGHTVTAIYELTPTSSVNKFIDDLRYKPAETESEPETTATSDEYAFLKMRYKLPGEQTSKLITVPITREMAHGSVDELTPDMRFAASVAAFGQKLRGNAHLTEFAYDEIIRIASGARGADPFGYRAEFLGLVRLAKSLDAGNR